MKTRVIDETANVRRAARKGSFKSIRGAAAYVRGVAQRSIGSGFKTKRDKVTGERVRVGAYKPSEPGKPPKSPTGRLRRSIVFDVDKAKGDAVIGPTKSGVGLIGRTHEFSGVEPPKAERRRPYNFVLRIGGHGPLRATRNVVLGVGTLRTSAQVRRANELVEGLDAPRWQVLEATKRWRNYPARPFMGPALVRARARLPAFWANAVKGS